MPFRCIGFNIAQTMRVEACFYEMMSASAKATEALLVGSLRGYRTWFENSGTNHLPKVAWIVRTIDEAINHRHIYFHPGLRSKQTPPGLGLPQIAGYTAQYPTRYGRELANKGRFRQSRPGRGWDLVFKPHGNHIHIYLYPENYVNRQDRLIQTIYHELSHAVGGTFDVSSDPAVCARNAIINPRFAVGNAENYALYMKEFLEVPSSSPVTSLADNEF